MGAEKYFVSVEGVESFRCVLTGWVGGMSAPWGSRRGRRRTDFRVEEDGGATGVHAHESADIVDLAVDG